MKLFILFSPFQMLEEGIVSLLLLIDSKIYGLFAKLYSLYLQLARAEIFQLDTFDNVIKNIYVIFGVVALFIIAFSLLQAMANPESISKGTKTTKDIIFRLLLCVGLTCITPFAFDMLYDVQNSILSYGTLTKIFVGDNVAGNTTSIDYNYTSDSGDVTSETVTIDNDEINKNKLQIYGNQMAYYVLSGFFYTNDIDGDGTVDDVVVNASKYFDTETGATAAGVTCGVAIVGTVALAMFGVLPAAVGTGTAAAAACIAGGTISLTVNGVLMNLTAEKFSWTVVSQSLIQVLGEFDYITAFSGAVLDGRMSYTPIISTIAGLVLLYMLFSFCLDLGVRAAKLVFYQIMAPISFLLSILPKNKELMTKWFKAVLSTWAEVFVRIVCVLGAALLISNLNFTELNSFGLVARAIIVLGIVAFAKQAPKLFSEITGIKSGNMKLGIKDKLKEGGLFTAAHAVTTAGSGLGGLIASKGNPFAAYRAGKSGWKNGNFKGIGAEAQRRQAYEDALASGATRTQMALNAVRGAFGFDSTADAAERRIKTGATGVENNSHSQIEYVDGNGNTHVIYSGSTAQIDDVTAEELKAKKTQNIGAMSDANDKMRDLDKKIKWASSQKSWKSAMDDEADKKFNDGKYEHNIRYIDSNGQEHKEKVNGKRLSELSQQGMKFLYSDSNKDKYSITYEDKDGNVATAKGKTATEINEILTKTGGTLISKNIESVTEKKIRDEVRAVFSTQELTSDSPNLIKNKTEAFFTTLDNEGGFNYQSFVYDENGRQVYKDGKAVIETGGFTSEIDENNDRIITHTSIDSNGKEHKTIFKSIGKGMLEYVDEEGNRKEMSVYDLSDMFDQKSKSTSGVLEVQKQSIAESEEFIRARDENEAIDAILKQRDEKVAEALQSQKQRGKEAAKKYTANRK